MKKNKIDALLVSSPINIHYLSGFPNYSREEREAYLLITKTDGILFTDHRYIEAVEKILPSNIESTIERPVSKKLNQIVKNKNIQKIGFESNLTFAEYKKLNKEVEAKFVLVEDIVENFRKIKDDDEIKKLQKAARLTNDAFEYVVPLIKLGITEEQVAYELEMYIKKYGGDLAFDSIVAFGPNSSIPHHNTSNKKLSKTDEFVLLDFGAKVDGYCADMTRTLLTKNSSSRAKKVYETVSAAQNEARKIYQEAFNNKKEILAIDGAIAANKTMRDAGFDNIPHGLGHGIGLEVHENPHLSVRSKDALEIGNYFSIEPGIYIPAFGGVRIEDDYLITENGLEQITSSSKLLAISI